VSRCKECDEEIPVRNGVGRQARYCSSKCRDRARRHRNAAETGHTRWRHSVGRKSRERAAIPSRVKLADSVQKSPIGPATCAPTKSISKTPPLHWQQVNEITWKLIGDEMARVPAAIGKWGGYNTPLALAWVIEVGWLNPADGQRWVARVQDWRYGPTSLARAKAAALARITGKPVPSLAGDRFSAPLDLVGRNQFRWRGSPALDNKTRTEIYRQEISDADVLSFAERTPLMKVAA
jgi:hypothetical protein